MREGVVLSSADRKRIQIRSGQLAVYIGNLMLTLHWPTFYWNFSYDHAYGVVCKTMIYATAPKNWKWHRSFALTILGFGFGGAWNHCEGPDFVCPPPRDYGE